MGRPELLDYVEAQTELSVIAVTEHDDLRPRSPRGTPGRAGAIDTTSWEKR
jgi:hypothetical protein